MGHTLRPTTGRTRLRGCSASAPRDLRWTTSASGTSATGAGETAFSWCTRGGQVHSPPSCACVARVIVQPCLRIGPARHARCCGLWRHAHRHPRRRLRPCDHGRRSRQRDVQRVLRRRGAALPMHVRPPRGGRGRQGVLGGAWEGRSFWAVRGEAALSGRCPACRVSSCCCEHISTHDPAPAERGLVAAARLARRADVGPPPRPQLRRKQHDCDGRVVAALVRLRGAPVRAGACCRAADPPSLPSPTRCRRRSVYAGLPDEQACSDTREACIAQGCTYSSPPPSPPH